MYGDLALLYLPWHDELQDDEYRQLNARKNYLLISQTTAAKGLICFTKVGCLWWLWGSSAPAGRARTLVICVSELGGGGTLVGKGFTLPAVNTCTPFSGFEDGGLAGGVAGTGCTDRKGNTFLLHYSYHNSFPVPRKGSYFESGLCRFEFEGAEGAKLPALGGCRGTVLTSPDNPGELVVEANLFACDVEVPEKPSPPATSADTAALKLPVPSGPAADAVLHGARSVSFNCDVVNKSCYCTPPRDGLDCKAMARNCDGKMTCNGTLPGCRCKLKPL